MTLLQLARKSQVVEPRDYETNGEAIARWRDESSMGYAYWRKVERSRAKAPGVIEQAIQDINQAMLSSVRRQGLP